jgi:hypothetical protein
MEGEYERCLAYRAGRSWARGGEGVADVMGNGLGFWCGRADRFVVGAACILKVAGERVSRKPALDCTRTSGIVILAQSVVLREGTQSSTREFERFGGGTVGDKKVLFRTGCIAQYRCDAG